MGDRYNAGSADEPVIIPIEPPTANTALPALPGAAPATSGPAAAAANSFSACGRGNFAFAGVMAGFWWSLFGANLASDSGMSDGSLDGRWPILICCFNAIFFTTLFLCRLHAMLAAIYRELRSQRADALHRGV